MANDRRSDKPAASPRKPPGDGLLNQPRQLPQIRSPLLNDGPELERDTRC